MHGAVRPRHKERPPMTIAIRMQSHEWTAILRAVETVLYEHDCDPRRPCPFADVVQARGAIETALLDQGHRHAIVREHVRGREVTR